MQDKILGAHLVQNAALSNSLLQVATAIPAFIGYTEKATDGSASVAGIPTSISSMDDYVRIFGGPPTLQFSLTSSADQAELTPALFQRFFLYQGVSLYFLNGGGPAYVLSVGSFTDVAANGMLASDFMPPADPAGIREAPLDALKKVPDVTLIVAPETTLLDAAIDCYRFWQSALQHCGLMQNRMALIDIYDGDKARSHDPDTDIISGSTVGFRANIGSDSLSYGASYYPWLDFDLSSFCSVTYDNLDSPGLSMLVSMLNLETTAMNPVPSVQMQSKMRALCTAIGQRLPPDPDPLPAGTLGRNAVIASNHNQLLQMSPLYARLTIDMLGLASRLPPASAMAGVYAQTDNTLGVCHAPANVGVAGAVSPTVEISDDDQAELNMPLDGMAVNAIRAIPGRGLVVWGARTLDGNSDDYRYINVRRTLTWLEQSIKFSMQASVFAPNTPLTWVSLQSTVCNFLDSTWKDGVLVGDKPEDAFQVEIGLGSTMTAEDVLNGYLLLSAKVAVVRPAEFIMLTFQQQQAVS